MSDYISREAAIKAIEERSCYNCGAIPKNCEMCRTRDHIKAVLSVPAADVRPVVRGHWYETDLRCVFKCSNCGKLFGTVKYNHCPNCGADMRGET